MEVYSYNSTQPLGNTWHVTVTLYIYMWMVWIIYMVPYLVSYVLGDCVLLSWNMLHSTIQYKKELNLAVLYRLCQSTYSHCVRPALDQFWWVEGGWMDMTRWDGRLIWPYPYTAVTVQCVLLSAAVHTVHYFERNLCVSFGATLLVDGLPGV